LKILFVIVTPPNHIVSGAVNAALMLANSLSDQILVEVLIFSDRNFVEVKSPTLLIRYFQSSSALSFCERFIPRSLARIFLTSKALLRYILISKCSLVHIHNTHPIQALCDVTRLCRVNKIPYVVSSHGFVETCNPADWLPGGFLNLLSYRVLVTNRLKACLKAASSIFFTSTDEIALTSVLNIRHKPTYIVPNGFNPSCISPLPPSARNFSQQFLQPGYTFLFVGNHTPNKGIDLLIKAISLSRVSWNLIIAGRIRDNSYLQDLCESYSVPFVGDRIYFTDYLSNEELLQAHNQSDAFVFPTRSDTFPLVVLDAMAMGLPIVSTYVGGIPSMVDRENGLLVQPNSVELAAAMDFLASNPAVSSSKGSASQKRALTSFSWEHAARKAIDGYLDILS